MDKERTFKLVKKARTPGFVHLGEIIPDVLRGIGRRIKKARKNGKGKTQ